MGEICSSRGKLAGGLSASLSGSVGASITHCTAMEERAITIDKKEILVDG